MQFKFDHKKFFKISDSDEKQFAEEFYKERIINERMKMFILGSMFGFLILYVFLAYLVFSENINHMLGGKAGVYSFLGIMLFLFIRQIELTFILNKRIKNNQKIPMSLRYINAFLEASIPTAGIIILSFFIPYYYALNSPVTHFYFVIIILTIFELDEKISLLSGLIASIEYVLLFLYYSTYSANPDEARQNISVFYYGKGLIIFVAGTAASLVSIYIKKSIYSAFHISAERNEIQKLFGQQVSKEVVEEIIRSKKDPSGNRKYVSILFLDIRGFSDYASTREPEEIVKYQNAVLSFMIDIVNKHKGIVNQILGDGFMATFGAPEKLDNPAQNATESAIEIVRELEEKLNRNEIPHTKIGIGIHAGYAVTGNVGTSNRKQYSITGNVVILASRIEQLNKEFNSQILVSEEVINSLSNIGNEYLGRFFLKGAVHQMKIFKLA